MTTWNILMLAGRCEDKVDPLAGKAGISHKARVPVRGKALNQWVPEAAEEAWPETQIRVSFHDDGFMPPLAVLERPTASGRLRVVEARQGFLQSPHAAAGECEASLPLLITTSDNVLGTPAALRRLMPGRWRRARAQRCRSQAENRLSGRGRMDSDGSTSSATRRFRTGMPIGCATAAFKAAESFRESGQFIMTPGVILKAFGLWDLIGIRQKHWMLEQAMRNMSHRLGVRIAPVFATDRALAVDAQSEQTYKIAEDLLESRKP